MFCLTFHYRSALTIFFDLCFIHCCQTVSLEAIWCFRVTSNLCFLLDGAAYCPSLNTRSMHFLKLKEGIMENILLLMCTSQELQCNTESICTFYADNTGRNVKEPCAVSRFRYLPFPQFQKLTF